MRWASVPASILGALIVATAVVLRPAGEPAVRAQADGAAAELIERVLNPPQPPLPQAGVAQRDARRVLFPGALPAGLPDDVPLPTGHLVGSIARIIDGQLAEIQVLVDVPGAPEDVRADYAEEAARRGWRPGPSAPSGQQGGFRRAPRPPGGLYCHGQGPDSLQLLADEGLGGGAEVRLDISLTGYALCSPLPAPGSSPPSPTPPFSSPGYSPPGFSPPGVGPGYRAAPSPPPGLVPQLDPPEGVPDPSEVLTPSGFPGSAGAPGSSQATLSTELSATELEAHYARQLEAAGWIRLAGGGERLAWSRWQATADGAWEALFLAFEEPDRPQRFVRLAVAATSRDPQRVEPRPLRSLNLRHRDGLARTEDREQRIVASRGMPAPQGRDAGRLAQQEVSPIEAAERLLSRPTRDLVGRRLWTRLLPGALPDELAAFPLPPAAHLVGTSVRMGDGHLLSADVMLDAVEPPDELLAFFDAELQRLGWSPSPQAMTAGASGMFPGGTQTGEYCLSESGPSVQLWLHPRADGGSHAQARAEIGETDRCLRQTRSSRPLSSELVPSLSGPAREPVSFSGRGQGRTETAVEAALSSEAPLDRLGTHFAEQLAAGGRTRLTSGGDASLAWSLWTLPDYGDWEALVVISPGADARQRTLFIRLKPWQDA